jgi:alpha-tubulin suppressor-like RCC1 family protein
LSGKLGSGNIEDIGDEPGEMPPIDVNVGGSVVMLEAGGHHTCAVLDTMQVRCWGGGTSGQLGNEIDEHIGDEPGEMPPPPVQLY